MNRRMKLIESYLLLLTDLCSITLAYIIAILIRYGKFARVMEPELHFAVYIGFCFFARFTAFCLTGTGRSLKEESSLNL